MGRLPVKYADKLIKFRIPFTMPGELVISRSTTGLLFADSTFLHNTDKPFEIHRMIVTIAAMDNATPPLIINVPLAGALGAGQMDVILRDYVRLRIQDTAKNELLTKAAQLVSNLVRNNTGAWEWEEPYTIVRSEGFTISVDTIVPANFVIAVGETSATVANLRVGITFEGFLIVIEPPSETR